MRNTLIASAVTAFILPLAASAATVLYTQNFENPNPGSFQNDSNTDVNIYNGVNTLYGGQPSGFSFAQDWTVETLLVGGSNAWGGNGFKDPQNIAGKHALGMLSNVQNDILALAFNVGAFQFLNFQLDISSIDLNTWGGPFNPYLVKPKFRFSLHDNPGGSPSTTFGTELSFAEVTGNQAQNSYTFNWSNHINGLSTAGNTNGNVLLKIDLLEGGYAAMDNFRIVASDIKNDVGTPSNRVPDSGPGLLLIGSLLGLAILGRRK
ncbi:hypothetical protein [Nibricoccus sp. IMCC34717]|uniref:hypothetical protein n=1 Tax=Nibricoccus sp. IMCC34717 TaxID=3034021 RepID=UPI00384ED2E4